jgi:hypothetical protein
MPAVGATSVNLHQRTRDQAERNVESKRAHRQGRVESHLVREAADLNDNELPLSSFPARTFDTSPRVHQNPPRRSPPSIGCAEGRNKATPQAHSALIFAAPITRP